MSNFEVKRINRRLVDLEKGYKELSYWHDQWKKFYLKANEATVKHTELQSEVHETLKIMTNSIMELRQIVQKFDPMAQAMLELADRVKKLEQKKTSRNHP